MRLVRTAGLTLLSLSAGFVAAWAAGTSEPGGAFERRLRQARSQAQPALAPQRHNRHTRVADVHKKPNQATARAGGTAPAGSTRVVTRVAGVRSEYRETVHSYLRTVPPHPPDRLFRHDAPYPAAAASMARRPAPIRASADSSVDLRDVPQRSDSLTGDLVLDAQPRDLVVHYTWDGGSRSAAGTTRIRGLLPREVRITAEVAGLHGRVETRATVRAGCTTTVRFRFRGF